MSSDVLLRDVKDEDLSVFFEHQQDLEACRMAAFTANDPTDRDEFGAHWARIRGDGGIIIKTIMCDSVVAGHVSSFEQSGEMEVSYWIGREFWGRGMATRALSLFLPHVPVRPLYARAAKDNLGSIRVLEKCGFQIIGEDKGFANARGGETEEYILELRADPE